MATKARIATATPRRTGGGGKANPYGAGGKLDGSVRKASREPEKRSGVTSVQKTATAPKTLEDAHKELRRRLAENHKQSVSRARRK